MTPHTRTPRVCTRFIIYIIRSPGEQGRPLQQVQNGLRQPVRDQTESLLWLGLGLERVPIHIQGLLGFESPALSKGEASGCFVCWPDVGIRGRWGGVVRLRSCQQSNIKKSRSGTPYSSIYSTLIFQNALLEFNILTYCTLNMACTQHTSGEVGPHPSPDVCPMAIQSQSLHPCQGGPSSSPQEPQSPLAWCWD